MARSDVVNTQASSEMARAERAAKWPDQPRQIEPRWPVALTILAVLLLLNVLPVRVRVLPRWFDVMLVIVILVPMIALRLSRAKSLWLWVGRWTTLLFILVAASATLVGLANLVHAMVTRSAAVGGLQLLASSIAIWVTNVLVFSLLYWELDRGGPEARANHEDLRPDWLFPQTSALEESPPDWRPTFVDYLFLAYSTATAFSTTDVMPLSSRAKMLMMLQSSISLATVVVVVSRAINILGS